MLLVAAPTHETTKNRSDEEQIQIQVRCADHCERENLEFQKFEKIRQDDENHRASALPRSAGGNQDICELREPSL